jgi:hypothetical protein
VDRQVDTNTGVSPRLAAKAWYTGVILNAISQVPTTTKTR